MSDFVPAHILTWITTLLGLGYFLAAAVIAVYSASFFILIAIYLRRRPNAPTAPHVLDNDLLTVTLQLPIYNEQHVVARLVDAVGALDYPRDKLYVQVLDDSTDDTTDMLRRKVAEWQAKGLNISLIHRPDRSGYKAGALAYSLERCTTECVGVFDADFVPAPDFLRRVMPHFNTAATIALVQTRWTHLNPDYNLLTRAQTLALDQHFAIEQVARSRGDLPMSMNGTGGIWRRAAIEDVGGWSAETLTEDMDLSYRAYLNGWRFRYLVDIAVPGEVPPQITAYKLQQARWAKGSTQCLIKHARALLRSDLTALQKLMGLLHMGQFAIQPFVLLLFLLTPPALISGVLLRLPLGPLGLAGIAPPVIIAMGQITLYRDWPKRLLFLPVLTVLGTGMMLSNSRAVLEAITGRGGNVFHRTPKFNLIRRGNTSNNHTPTGWQRYVIRPDWTTTGELVLGVYAVLGSVAAAAVLPAILPYMALYVIAFGTLSLGSLWQTRNES
ncbi:MAG: glycosyltransferase [Anaerolineae bacterium]|nr:glycosyltransferase [Anaerolineae bacterium]